MVWKQEIDLEAAKNWPCNMSEPWDEISLVKTQPTKKSSFSIKFILMYWKTSCHSYWVSIKSKHCLLSWKKNQNPFKRLGTELERKSKLQKKGNCHLEARLQNKLERKLAIFPYQEEQEVSFLCLTKRRNSWETRIALNPLFERSVAMKKIKVGTKRNWANKPCSDSPYLH